MSLPIARTRDERRSVLLWALLGLLWSLVWLLPVASASFAAAAAPTVMATVSEATPGTRAADDGSPAAGWQLPSADPLAAIEPSPEGESDPAGSPAPADRPGFQPARCAFLRSGDVRFRPDACRLPHGHAPPRA